MANLASLANLPGLSEIEDLIQSSFRSDAPMISEISRYLLGLGGKRIRPVLTLLCGQLFGVHAPLISSEKGRKLVDIAAGIELIHMATLLHDDIIDKSPVRRHKPSPFQRFGAERTLLAGDFLLTRAFGLCARLDRFVIERTEAACVALTEGEILETSLVEETHSIESSLLVARKKTAALFSLAAETAAHIAATSPETVAHMARFGENLGIAFQILDDILDVTSNEATLGKPEGQDLRERKPSLVNVLWLESGDPAAQHLRKAPTSSAQGVSEEEWITKALSQLRSSAVINEARAQAESYVAAAQDALTAAQEDFSRSSGAKLYTPAREMLELLMRFVLERVK